MIRADQSHVGMYVFVKLLHLLLPKQPIRRDNLKNSRKACYMLLRSLKFFFSNFDWYIFYPKCVFSYRTLWSHTLFTQIYCKTKIEMFWSKSMQKNVPWFARHCVLCVFLAMLASMYYKTGCVRWSKQATRFSSHPLS